MEMSLKTKDVATKLGVNQKTVQRWIRHFGLKCETNELGHYVISQVVYEQLAVIQEQLNSGKRMSEISLKGVEKKLTTSEQMVSSQHLDERFNRLLFQIDQLDRKIQNKAGEVVEIQMLQHRKEIDEITETLERFDLRLKNLENALNNEADKVIPLKTQQKEIQRSKKRRFASIFSF
ncbi:chromosome-anchoring protein RacA [Evansella vedderi]|uniref:Chromosome-anchoring protein RacA n=1 Tax=Evansella vedderi TaxID=38282 RepID=A0ABT9ZWK5_9BACI|nr:MerR family transcriptional regulator [Evansella vedderi]MDQ0255249.1 chromosome-anchoring protein RacA [Evansella vedderi]